MFFFYNNIGDKMINKIKELEKYIGNTKMVLAKSLMKKYNLKSNIYLKLEKDNYSGSIDKLNTLINEYNNIYILDQFNNKLGVDAHYKTTGVEIYNEINNIDIFISGIGTGGTFTGCAKYLKEKDKNTLCIGIDPSESKVLKGEKSSIHKIEGIGANFIPSILDT